VTLGRWTGRRIALVSILWLLAIVVGSVGYGLRHMTPPEEPGAFAIGLGAPLWLAVSPPLILVVAWLAARRTGNVR